MEIKRDFYINKLISKKHNGLIKVITGIRRCGKSYLLNTMFYRHLIENKVPEDHIIRFAFDSGDDLELIGENIVELDRTGKKVDPSKFLKYIKSKINDNQMYYLLLDEIQRLDCFETVLNGYLYKNNMDVYVTGSNAKLLSKDIITEFSGRGDELHLYPLSFNEFMSIYQGDIYKGLIDYMTYGGIPLVSLKESKDEKISTLKNLFSEIYITDLVKRNKIRNIGELEDILDILSSSIGSLTNPEKLKNTFKSIKQSKITSNTIRSYIGYLEDAFLTKSANRYDIKGKHYIESPKKYYFTDLGLRNARINFRQLEMTHSMENVIYNELVRRGFNVDVGTVEINEANENGIYVRKQLEIDFVCNRGYERYYIQSSLSLSDSNKINQELRPFKKVNDSFKKIIIVGELEPTYYNDDGILIMNIYDFLLNENSIN